MDALIYYHEQLIPASICGPVIAASMSALTLEQGAPLVATLHFLRDFLSYGTDHPNSSHLSDETAKNQRQSNSQALQNTVKSLVLTHGEALVQRILTGMMFSFPRDCLQDASGVMLALCELMPQETIVWIKSTLAFLPTGTIKAGEGERLMTSILQKMQLGDLRKVRVLLQGKTKATYQL